MRRREFIRAFGGAAAVWPLMAFGQEALQPPLVAVLSPLSSDAAALNIQALREGFRDHGYIEGKNFVLELRYGNGMPELMAREAAELVSLKPAVILTGSEAGILAVHNATSTIPIVMTGVIRDPVALGLVKSIRRPGGNITGTWIYGDGALFGKRLELLKDAVPGATHIGVLVNLGDPTDDIALKLLPPAAPIRGLRQPPDAADVAAVEIGGEPLPNPPPQACHKGEGRVGVSLAILIASSSVLKR